MEDIFESLKTFVMTENWDDLEPIPSNYTMKGHKHTEESKLKMSKASKGRKAWNKGIKMSDKFCDDVSKRMKGKKRRLGAKLSQESKDKISKALKKHHERI